MGLTASLKRAEEVALTPRLPVELNTTGLPVIVTPKIPAIKVPFCVPCFPIRILADSPATPGAPISMSLPPVVRLTPALLPKAMLLLPVALAFSA
jgi:hypothetical protein